MKSDGFDKKGGSEKKQTMATFDELVVSRKAWIDQTLKTWCRDACSKDLRKADAEWGDIAGRVDTESTLWTWAWSRFPDLVHDGLNGVDETAEVRVTLKDGRTLTGFPDGRRSQNGQLVLLCTSTSTTGAAEFSDPYSIDDIASVKKMERA